MIMDQSLEKIEYHFKCGIKCCQEEATYRSDKSLMKLLKQIDIGGLKDVKEMKFTDLIEKILDQDILLEAFMLILKPVDSSVPLNLEKLQNLTREECIKVIKDFFTLSPSLKSWLGIGKPEPGLLSRTEQTMN